MCLGKAQIRNRIGVIGLEWFFVCDLFFIFTFFLFFLYFFSFFLYIRLDDLDLYSLEEVNGLIVDIINSPLVHRSILEAIM